MRLYPDVPIWMRPTDFEPIHQSTPDTYKKWSAEEKIQLLKLREKGVPFPEIAKRFGRGYWAVKNKHRMLRGEYEEV